jgi:hypothetical protein
MHDLIVNAIGATIVGLMGYAYARSGRFSFLVDALRAFMQKNPRLFRSAPPRNTNPPIDEDAMTSNGVDDQSSVQQNQSPG